MRHRLENYSVQINTKYFRVILSIFFLFLVVLGSACSRNRIPSAHSGVNQFIWNFEDGLQGWKAEGNAFTHQPIDGPTILTSRVIKGGRYAKLETQLSELGGQYWDVPYPINIQGRKWIGTAEAQIDSDLDILYPKNIELLSSVTKSLYPGAVVVFGFTWYFGESLVGKVSSPEFILQRPYIHFLIGGSCDARLAGLRVESKNVNGEWQEVMRVAAQDCDDEVMRRASINVSAHEGEMIRLVIYDEGGAHINVDDIHVSNRLPKAQVPMVWGLADTHAHPMSHLGFGQRLIWGSPDETLVDGPGTDHGANESRFAAALIGQLERNLDGNPEGGNVLFKLTNSCFENYRHSSSRLDYIRWQNTTHHAMSIDWMRRVYRGGLRLMVADAINSRLLDFSTSFPADQDPETDSDSYLRQIVAMKALALDNSDWMEVALSPKHAREIIADNRLAVVLSIEVDSFGDCDFANGDFSHNAENSVAGTRRCTDEDVETALEKVHDLGVRQLHMMHLTDNQFGGSAIYDDFSNANNYFINHQYSSGQYASGRSHETGVDFVLRSNMRLGESSCMLIPIKEPATPRPIVNFVGLRDSSLGLIDKMRGLGIMLAADHMSERTLDALLDIKNPNFKSDDGFTSGDGRVYPFRCEESPEPEACFMSEGWPIIFTHTNFRELSETHHRAENQKTKEQRRRVHQLGGIIAPGIISESGLSVTELTDGPTIMNLEEGIPNDCPRTSKAYAQSLELLYQEWIGMGRDITKLGVPLGTDFNGLNGSVRPRKGPECGGPLVNYENGLAPDQAFGKKWDINAQGVAHYGMLPDFLEDLREVGASRTDLRPLFLGAESYIRMWENVCSKAFDYELACNQGAE